MTGSNNLIKEKWTSNEGYTIEDYENTVKRSDEIIKDIKERLERYAPVVLSDKGIEDDVPGEPSIYLWFKGWGRYGFFNNPIDVDDKPQIKPIWFSKFKTICLEVINSEKYKDLNFSYDMEISEDGSQLLCLVICFGYFDEENES